jgi:hypothetical protein
MRTSLCWLVITVTACGSDKAASPPSPQGSAVAPARPAATSVEIFVNDASVAVVSAGQLATWPRLDALVPAGAGRLGTWELVTLTGRKPKPTEVPRPSGTYPDMVPAVFPGEDGAPAFGMFDAVELGRHGQPALREDHVSAIRIKIALGGNRGQNDDSAGGGGDLTKLTLAIKSAAGTTALASDKLLALPREPIPGNPDQKGWRLTTLLAAAGITSFSHLVLSGASGVNLTLDHKDLDATTIPFVKLNKKGELRMRVLKKVGLGWNPVGDVQALVAIEVK